MRRPTFSFIVPTHREDRPLQRCLESVLPQLGRSDQVLVVGDTHDGPLPAVEALVRSYGPRFRYLAHDAGHHCFGHCQINAALPLAKGRYVHCNDDDDTWAPGAVDAMRSAIAETPGLPLLFRFRAYWGTSYWQERGLFARDHIGGHCLVAPNVAGKVGRFACQYSGDFDWLASTVAYYGGPEAAVWRDELVAIARPA